jgi:hypothetical protein
MPRRTASQTFTYSTMRLSKSNGTTFDNDAKSCYDRIVLLFASLASQRIGMPAKACELLLSTLSQVKYRTRTIHRVSDSTYHTTRNHTIHGPGQGGRASPAIWTDQYSATPMYEIDLTWLVLTGSLPKDNNTTNVIRICR